MVTAEAPQRVDNPSLDKGIAEPEQISFSELALAYPTIQKLYESLREDELRHWKIGTFVNVLSDLKKECHYPLEALENLLVYLQQLPEKLQISIQVIDGNSLHGGVITHISENEMTIGIPPSNTGFIVPLNSTFIYKIDKAPSSSGFAGNWKKELAEKRRLNEDSTTQS